MNQTIERQNYDDFILHKISRNELTDIEYEFLTSVQGESNLREALNQLGIQQEFLSFQNQLIKNSQDAKLQQTIIKDKVRILQKKIQKINSDLIPLQKEYKNWHGRNLLYPENPTFQSKTEVLQKQIDEKTIELNFLESEIQNLRQ